MADKRMGLPFWFRLVRPGFNAFVSRKQGGMGMGLAICRSIVEAQHGNLALSRDPVLGGAHLTIELPLAQNPATTRQEAA